MTTVIFLLWIVVSDGAVRDVNSYLTLEGCEADRAHYAPAAARLGLTFLKCEPVEVRRPPRHDEAT
jgi:hypothetical protein